MKPNIHVATAAGVYGLPGTDAPELEHLNTTDIAPFEQQWWAATREGSILRTEGDAQWTEVASLEERTLNCLLPTSAGTFVGTDHAHLMRLTETGAELVESFASAPGRDGWFTPWGGPPDVRSLAFAGGTLFVNVHVGGILRSDDGASTWSPTIDIRSDVHEVIAADPESSEVVLAATALGLAVSRDRGTSWEFDDDELEGSYARAVALAGDRVFLTASLGPRGGRAAIYRRALDAPGGFEKIHNGLPESFQENIDSGCVVARDDVAVFGTSDGRVFVSEKGGDSWELLADGLPPIHRVRLDP